MKNKTLITVFVVVLALALVFLWALEPGADVEIVDLHAPPIGASTPGKLDIVLRNNEPEPVDIWLDVENAFVDENGISHPTSRVIIPENSRGPWDVDFVSLQKPITLLPGNNSVKARLGYRLPGEYELEVKVSEDSRLLDSASLTVEVQPPELSLKLEYEKVSWKGLERGNDIELYGIYGYLINYGPSLAEDVCTNLSVTEERTGETVFTSSEVYDVGGYDKTTLWTWPDYPYALIEITRSGTSEESYVPVQNVIRGKTGDVFRVNVSSEWGGQTVSTEILVPAEEESVEKSEKKSEEEGGNP